MKGPRGLFLRAATLCLLPISLAACSRTAFPESFGYLASSGGEQDRGIMSPAVATVGPAVTPMATPVTGPAFITAPSSEDDSHQSNQLQLELEEVVASLSGTYGVAALNLSSGETIGLNESEFFPSASLYKLVVLYEAYRQAETGRISLAASLEIRPQHLCEAADTDLRLGDRLSIADALRLMITVSSNSAAYAVLDEIGWARFNQAAGELGLRETSMPMGSEVPLQPEWRAELASTSPRDVLRFFELLYRRQLVSAEASDAMLSLLLDQQVNDRIPAGLPNSLQIAHKTGELTDVWNDAGIVFTESNAYVLVVLSMDVHADEALTAIADIAKLVHSYFG